MEQPLKTQPTKDEELKKEEKQGTNKDHEAEKAAEKEKWEKDIGLLTYLGQSAVETQEKTPWYLAKRKELTKEEKFDVKDRKLKESHDPLRQMSSYLHTKHKHTDRHKDSSHTKKHKKKKNKDKEKHRKSSSSSKTIEQLRAERLKREQMERQKVRDMFSGQGSKVKDIEEPISERDRGYNSQFNPEFVRKPKQADDASPRSVRVTVIFRPATCCGGVCGFMRLCCSF
ncbi:LENG1-like protein [Mya arenaria]|uniref:LENG1-like protein n=1 Tax=Mya arenaria TaxID=6604 RepID=A0ABY7E1C3_MYAAR|nr:LENG1-like protein [Mya arenaria]